jgi:TRAP-type mannitol/chloroaromatic compound transport system permease small subunit
MPDEPTVGGNGVSTDRPGGWVTFGRLTLVLNSIGTIWIIILMVVINLDVLGRSVFAAPVPGVPELVRLSIVGIVFIQLGHTLRVGRMIQSDSLIGWLSRRWPRAGSGLRALFSLTGAVLFAVLLYASFPFLTGSWASGEYFGVEGYVAYPVWPVRLIILIGCACAVIQYLIFAYRSARGACGMDTGGGNDDAAANSALGAGGN